MITTEDLYNLVADLMPQGRAFDVRKDETYSSIINAIVLSFVDGLIDLDKILTGLDPKNPSFTANDALKLEKRKGLLINENLDLASRKQALIARFTDPGDQLAKQSASYIEYRLQQAGFNVFVHENRFLSGTIQEARYNEFIYGGAKYGGDGNEYYAIDPSSAGYTEFVKNYIDYTTDQLPITQTAYYDNFRYGENTYGEETEYMTKDEQNRTSFFIGDQVFGDFASVPNERREEFRHLVLKLKPAHTEAYLLINFI